MDSSSTEARLAEDMLNGANEIAEFLFGNADHRSRIYYLCATGQLPSSRLPI